jgi:small subunit ribosomal protein S1
MKTEDVSEGLIEKEELERLYEETFKTVKEGTVIKGKVAKVRPEGVMVDIGYKSEGIIPVEEFSEKELKEIKTGDEIEVYLEERENEEGNTMLSKEKADKIKVWEAIEEACEKGEPIEGRIVAKIKGGMTVDVLGVKAFLPGSQIDLRPIKNLDQLIGKSCPMKVLKVNQKRGNIILSRRAVLEEDREKKKGATLARLNEGGKIQGVVKNITEYGVFIDLGGIDGLLHITDMSWGRISHPSELFMVGDKVDVVVLKYDKENERVSLGFKQKTPDPWGMVEDRYPVGKKVRGKVVSVTEYGAFVELEEGIEGLVHVSEMSWIQKIKHPSKLVAMGDVIDAIVLSVDKENRKISLGMKQVEPNPWDIIAEKYKVGDRIEGRIRSLTEFGAFVGLDEGIDGLIHISDLSWTRHIKHPSEILKKGQKVEAVVLSIDKDKERISLGIKQLTTDPWEKEIPERFKVGSLVKGKVVKITEFGIFLELEEGIEGLVYSSEIDKGSGRIEDVAKVGEEITTRIVKVDTAERKIGLTMKIHRKGKKVKVNDS